MNGGKINPEAEIVAKTETPDFGLDLWIKYTSLVPLAANTCCLPGSNRTKDSSQLKDRFGSFKISSKFLSVKT